MRAFETASMYDKENEEWTELYFIDGEEFEAEEYFEEIENEQYDEDECDCDECCDCCDCVAEREYKSEVVSDFVEDIQATNGCPDCIKEIIEGLYELAYEDGSNDAKNRIIDIINEDLDD